jgi:hypothetical protein
LPLARRMGEPKRVGKIQVEEDLQFLKREWRLQRVGWIAMALVLFAALLGAFGHGALSQARAGDPRIFGAEYSRIIRHGSTDELTILVGPALQADSVVRIAISSAYLTEFQIEDVQPEPAAQHQSGEYTVFDFRRIDPRSPLRVRIKMRSDTYGSVSARMQLMGSNTLNIRQFIMP